MLEVFSTTIALMATGAWAGVASQRRGAAALPFGLVMALLAAAGWTALFFAPRDFWMRHLWASEFIHPYVLTLDSVLAIFLGAALIVIGLTSRRSA